MQSIDQAAVTQLAPGGRRHHHLGRTEDQRKRTPPASYTSENTQTAFMLFYIYTPYNPQRSYVSSITS